MLSVPHRAQDDKFTNSIEGYRGSVHKLGRLLAHDWFSVCFGDVTKERYLFLFKARILISKVRRVSDDRSVFQLKDIIKLPQVEVKDRPEDSFSFELSDREAGHALVLTAHRENVKEFWLKEIREYATEAVDEGGDDLQVISQPTSPPEPAFQLKHPAEEVAGPPTKKLASQTGAVSKRSEEKSTDSALTTSSVESKTFAKYEESRVSVKSVSSQVTKTTVSKVETSAETISSSGQTTSSKVEASAETKQQIVSSSSLSTSGKVEALVGGGKAETTKAEEVQETAVGGKSETTKAKEETTKAKEETTKAKKETTKFKEVKESAVGKQESVKVEGETTQAAKAKVKEVKQSTVGEQQVTKVDKETTNSAKSEAKQTSEKQATVKVEEAKVEVKTAITSEATGKVESDLAKSTVKAEEVSKTSASVKSETSTAKEATKSNTKVEVKSKVGGVNPKDEAKVQPTELRKDGHVSIAGGSHQLLRKDGSKVELPDYGDSFRVNLEVALDVDGEDRPHPTEYGITAPDDMSYGRRSTSTSSSSTTRHSTVHSKSVEGGRYTESSSASFRSSSLYDDGDSFRSNRLGSLEGDLETTSRRRFLEDGKRTRSIAEERRFRGSVDEESSDSILSKIRADTYQRVSSIESESGGGYSRRIEGQNRSSIGDESYSRLNRSSLEDKSYSRLDKSSIEDDSYSRLNRSSLEGHSRLNKSSIEGDSYSMRNVEGEISGSYRRNRSSIGNENSGSYRRNTSLEGENTSSYRRNISGEGENGSSYRRNTSLEGETTASYRRKTSVEGENSSSYRRKSRLSIDEDTESYKTLRSYTSIDNDDNSRRSQRTSIDDTGESRLAKFEKYSKSKTNGADSFQTVTQKTAFDGKNLEEAVRRSKSREDLGMAPPDEPPKFTKAMGGSHIKLTEEEQLELKKPDFLVKLKDTELMEDTYLRFMLKIKGDPTPTLTFYKDDKRIQESERISINRDHSDHDFYELVIPHVSRHDAGVYKCVAKNEHGEATTEATVTITDNKHLFDDIPDKETLLPKGEKPSFLWRKDGVEFEAEERFKVLMGDDEDSLALIFQHVKPEDAGLYTCVAQTSTGHISCSAELTVQGTVHELYREPEKPQLIIEKREAITSIKASCMMELQVKGFPKPKVTWTHEGKAVEPSSKYKFLYEDEESMSLVIKDVQPSDAGKYEITAENELGQDIREMHLVVKAPPTISKMTDTTAATEQELKMTAVVEGIPKPSVQFYKDGKAIKDSSKMKIVEEGSNHSIVIKETALDDSGSYSVVAINEMAQVSQFWDLHVYCMPKILKKLGYDTSVSQNIDYELTVQFSSDPPPEVTWYKDDKEITSDGHYTVSNDGDTYRLKISGTVVTDSARYKCKAKNIHGTVDDEIKIDVKRAPTITSGLKDLTVTEGDENVTLNVKVDSFPRPAVRWFLDEVEITESRSEYTRSEEKDGASLIVKQVNTDLSGRYTCKFSNELGEVSASAQLTVNCKPKIIKHLKDTTVEEGATLHLEVEVLSTPEPTVKWLRNGREISADARIKITRDKKRYETFDLVVDLVKFEEQGEYEVQVTNMLGTTSSKSSVTVHKVTHTDAVEEEATEYKVELVEDVMKKGEETEMEKSKTALGSEELEIKEVSDEEQKPIVEDAEPPKLGLAETQQDNENKVETVDLEKAKAAALKMSAETSHVKPPDKAVPEEVTTDVPKRGEEIALPQIAEHNMKDTTQYASLGTTFSVTSTGNPTPTAAWSLNGNPIKPGSNLRFKVSDEGNLHKLEIVNLDLKDAGVYECTVSNCVGDVKHQAKLDIIDESELRRPKVREGQGLKDQTILKKEAVVHKAVIVGEPVPDVTWCFEGKEITNEEFELYKMELETVDRDIEDTLKECTFSLTIPRCERINGGTYTLKVKNKWGTAETSGKLNVVLCPEIYNLDYIKCIPGQPAELTCIIQSNPPPIVTWTKSENVLEPTDNMEILQDLETETYTIRFKKIQLSDEGYYKVYAKNEYGDSSGEGMIKTTTDKPQFITGLSDVQCEDGGEVSLMVRVDGVPKPDVNWSFNGKPITDAPELQFVSTSDRQLTCTLTITNFSEKDEGIYQVHACNVVGDVETMAKAKLLQTPPSFIKRLERSEEVNEGEPLVLRAKVAGSPKPKVTWFKDGERIKPDDERIKTEHLPDGTVKLTIDEISPIDSGAYKLVIKNKNGETAGLCAVAVNATPRRPKFKKCIKDTKVVLGEQLKLTAKVEAYPPPEVKWLKDGLPMRGTSNVHLEHHPDGTVALVVDSVKPENAGKYTLIIGNKMGEITGDAKVEIEKRPTKPEFVQKLFPQTVVEGFPVKFEVKAVGHPMPTITWTRNGAEVISDSKHIKVTDQPDGSSCLVIEAADEVRDAITYVATAKNDAGESQTSALLTVKSAAKNDQPEERPVFLHDLKDVITDEGQPLVLEAPFTGNPIPSVEWTKDGQRVEPSDRVLLTCDGRRVGLKIDHSLPSDAGVYGVVITNPLGSESTSAKASVHKVFQPPKFTQRFTDLQQLPDRDAKFAARVTGVPQPEVTWSKDGQPIKETDKYRIKRDGDACCLYVANCTAEDNGTYTATAKNKEGEDSCIATLEVVKEIKVAKKIEPANFVKRIGDTELYKSMTAKFTACVAGIPEPTVEWYRNDQRLYPSDRIRMEKDTNGLLRLTIAGVDQDDLGKYTCKIHNEHGSDSCDAQLRFDEGMDSKPKKSMTDQYTDYGKYKKSGAPMPLSDAPIISRMTDRHCTLSWKPSIPSGPRAPVTYQLEMLELPTGDWFTARSGIRSCCCDVRNLEPFRDYKFRVRVENMYGISDPSPYALTHREKLEPSPPKFMPYLPPGIDFRPETSPYFPKDFDIDRPPHDNMAQAPRFLRQENDAQYGVKEQNTNLFWFVYGYPKPKMAYYFNDDLIEPGGRFDMSYTRNGQATLFINKMLERDVGWYEAVATNEHGEARQRVRLEIAELPTFVKRPDIEYVMVRDKARFEPRILGVPYPEIKWYKDWKPLANSSRTKIQFMEPDTAILIINDAIYKDEGLYSVSARNVAGSISASAMLHVEENDLEYNIRTYQNPSPIKMKKKPYSEAYDLGDELGRGTQGVTYHAVERLNGRNYAAKVMHGRGDYRPMMYNEWEIMNQLCHRRLIGLHDAYEHEDSLTLVLELAGGGELVKDYLIKQDYYTESEIASYMRQLLQGLQYMHERGFGHMGLNIGDLLLSHAGSDELKITDFGLSRRIQMGRLYPLKYGVPEYVSPEAANGEGAGLGHDMWSVGIITYILLSGRSPFRGEHDRETLTKIQSGKWSFDESWWCNLSLEARDFITKLLVYQADGRMDVHAALRHPWLERADKMRQDEYRISSQYLRDYYVLYREWYDNANCRKWFRRRPLEGAFTHPSKMVYPPGERYTPPPEEPPKKVPSKPRTWEDQIPSRSPLNYEIGSFKSESHYQNGPDTYLLQLRDVDFPVRLREYMKVAGSRGIGYAHIMSNENGYDWETPVIRERRRFTDIMDEEIDDERRARISRYGAGDAGFMVRRLRHEIGTRLDTYAEAEAFLESKMEGRLPFFREKPQSAAMREGFDLELVCLAVGDPEPVVQWFKNDAILAESHRVKIEVDEFNRSHLKLSPALSFDVGTYKVVARNKIGQTITRTRIVLGTVPDAPDSPEASQVADREILLNWKQPKHDGNSPIICYSVQYKLADDMEWTDRASNVDHEFYLMRDLEPAKNYIFRLACKNSIGWSDYGVASAVIMTQPPGVAKVQMSKAMMHLQQITDSGTEVVVEPGNVYDYSIESSPIEWTKADPQEKYSCISEVYRGKFSSVLKALDKANDTVVVTKVIDTKAQGEEHVEGEFSALRSLRNERIAMLLEAYKAPDGTSVFVLEKLQGADILTYLSSRHEYTEQTVATIVSQVLDGLQYLHWRGLCHLDLQPDNVVMCGVRSVQVKLVDFGSAHRVTKLGNKVPVVGHPDYISPEVLNDEPAYPQTDIWSLGVLTYVMLSGTLPFKGEDDNESRQNVLFVRYRFEHLYKEVSQEGVRFVMLLFKRQPNKRPTAEECHENRWLLPTDFMIKKRERAVFLGNRLKEYSDAYHAQKTAEQATSLSGKFNRSQSMQEELDTAPF